VVTKQQCLSGAYFTAVVYLTEESVVLFQAATDEHWGAGCSRIMGAFSLYEFERHF
jgi:hypothetical protein